MLTESRTLRGKGINECSRIKGKADGGQILVGDEVFKSLKERSKYASAAVFRPYLAPVKHGVLLPLHQFVDRGRGYSNVDVPDAFKTSIDVAQGKKESARRGSDLRTRGLKISVEIGPSGAEAQWAKAAKIELREPCVV